MDVERDGSEHVPQCENGRLGRGWVDWIDYWVRGNGGTSCSTAREIMRVSVDLGRRICLMFGGTSVGDRIFWCCRQTPGVSPEAMSLSCMPERSSAFSSKAWCLVAASSQRIAKLRD